MPILVADEVCFSYDNSHLAIDKLSLCVNRGEYIAVIGHNGSGKSTLAKLFNGLITPSSGKIIVDGVKSSDKNSLFEIRKKVGVVFKTLTISWWLLLWKTTWRLALKTLALKGKKSERELILR